MIETITALALAYLVTWPAILLFCLLGIACEHRDSRGWAVFYALAAIASSYFFFNMSLQTILVAVGAYLAVGVTWSIYRYSRFVTESVTDLKTKRMTSNEITYAKERLHPLKMVDTLVAWIIIWPFSLIEHAISDILDALEKLVTKVFRGVYVKIYENAVKDLTITTPDDLKSN
jgi:hypothetical protein